MLIRDQEAGLTRRYQDLSDEQLLELAAKASELTELAREVLTAEMRSRRISPRELEARVDAHDGQDLPLIESPDIKVERQIWYASPGDYAALAQEDCVIRIEEGDRLDAIRTSLTMADIPYDELWPNAITDLRHPILAVRPEDRERAREVLSKPLTPEAAAQIQAEIDDTDDWEVPICPACGASDPLLQSVDPVNTWCCEECGHHWVEA